MSTKEKAVMIVEKKLGTLVKKGYTGGGIGVETFNA